MNALGLLILNDLDNIVGALFVFVAGLENEDELEPFIAKDRGYALSFVFPSLIWITAYSLVFLGIVNLEILPP